MARFPAYSASQFSEDTEIWQSLKSAIATSSGFQRWVLERLQSDRTFSDISLDVQVQRYLRETLENLAY